MMAGDDVRRDESRPRGPERGPQEEAPPADPREVESLANDMLHGLGLELDAHARDAGETIEVDLKGPDRDLMLDHRGEALNALQYLLNRVVYRGRIGKKIHLDSEGYRRSREDEIVEVARRTAEGVLARGQESLLSPLNPYERRLVHLALGEMEGIGTRSVGDGFLKRIAVFRTAARGPKAGPAED
jgi:predicted RNA-binding protein Jag